ncbi:hypothetical protein [Phaeodactylibacter luteus]|uniref:Uncharacterized protein n=1 Tax=Phaeodactylibacter luteus TaxID=1564516 RepID=A0A5C6RFJ2_9BACT|nr:hypothetical protein [Phaeodactylibacter luteus]TXB54175.1 hypothetical protein FRY97_22015 [Phaeodactylibacter luteus]
MDSTDNWVEPLNLDTEEFIVSGTFQRTLFDPNGGDTLFITDGCSDYNQFKLFEFICFFCCN